MYQSQNTSRLQAWIAVAIACSVGSIAIAADTNSAATETILTGLKSPASVAIRPEAGGTGYDIVVAESGAGRVIKIRSNKPDKKIDVVSGFAAKQSGGNKSPAAGVNSVFFLDHMRLAVAGGDEDGKPFVRLYELPEPESPLTVDQHKDEAKLTESDKDPHIGAHAFSSLTRTQPNDRVGDYLLAAAPADAESAELVYVPVRAGTLAEVIPARLTNAKDHPQIGGLAVGDSGYVAVASNSAGDASQSSVLSFFSPLDRRVVVQMPTELGHIVALAYSPKTGNLYAANAPAADDKAAGIYRIDSATKSNVPACKAVKIADVKSPTALAFAPDGALYVTAFGDPKDSNSGMLLKLSGNL